MQQLPVGPPVLRRTAVLERVRGIVSVRPRGKKKFVRLTDPALIRVGSEIDVERGVARADRGLGRHAAPWRPPPCGAAASS